MITLYGFGPAFGSPDPSPFVVKALILLKMSGQDFTLLRGNMRKAPKGKLPYIIDNGVIIPDSTLIRLHLEQKYGHDFDAGASPDERAASWMFEKTCEDHLYWGAVYERWVEDANFNAGPAQFFKPIPALIRPLIVGLIRKKVQRNLQGQGSGRYTPEERTAIMSRAVQAMADYLTRRDFLGGAQPCGSDAGVYATLAALLKAPFDSALAREVQSHPALVSYIARMDARYFPA